MVRALLEGRKTQTRRVLKPLPAEGRGWLCDVAGLWLHERHSVGAMRESHSPDRASRYAPGRSPLGARGMEPLK